MGQIQTHRMVCTYDYSGKRSNKNDAIIKVDTEG